VLDRAQSRADFDRHERHLRADLHRRLCNATAAMWPDPGREYVGIFSREAIVADTLHVELLLVGGKTVETDVEGFDSEQALAHSLPTGRPIWLSLGNVIVYSSNIVGMIVTDTGKESGG
jgi:hypothetical protein